MNHDLKKLMDDVDASYAEFKRRAQKAIDEKDWTIGAWGDVNAAISAMSQKCTLFQGSSILTAKP